MVFTTAAHSKTYEASLGSIDGCRADMIAALASSRVACSFLASGAGSGGCTTIRNPRGRAMGAKQLGGW
eukprot:CAMPEP_0184395464 /NCGR_PEP_ID=MMETSP0007-20130409/44337_1 /TAXON_ID=97485 /ORGANISM="Prymnesium parvum, Strain Texoma1" /LENGTH=68 /DNA_ID=CAMNT_0026747639 /DNA_START=330 /DNA_END=536 /DNA_ORIENTATION=+